MRLGIIAMRRIPSASKIVLSAAERQTLETLAGSRKTEARIRAWIVLVKLIKLMKQTILVDIFMAYRSR